MPITNPPSANMGIVTPVVLGEVGPLWASELNTALATTIDAHDHTTGKGVRIPTAGLNINANLDFNDFGLDAVGYYAMTAIAQPAGAHPIAVFASVQGGVTELFYEDDQGRDIQITNNGTVGGTVNIDKGFTGDYDSTPGTGTASAYYDSASATFVFYRAPGPTFNTTVRANIQAQSLWLRPPTPASGLRLTTGAASASESTTQGYQFYANTNSPIGGALLWDSVSADYVRAAVQWVPAGVNHLSYFGVNTNGFGSGTIGNAAAPLEIRYQNATNNAVIEMQRIAAHASTTPNIGWGPVSRYYGITVNDSAVGTMDAAQTLMGEIGFQWADNPSVHAGIKLRDSTSGALNANSVLESDGQGHVGILTAAGGTALTVGGTVKHGGTGDLGTTGAYWATTYTNAVTAAGALTLTSQAGGAIAVSAAGAVNVTGTVVTTNATIRPTVASSSDLGSSSLQFARAHVDSAAFHSGAATKSIQTFESQVIWAACISSGGSIVREYTQNNSLSSITHSTGNFALNFNSAIPTTQALVLATINDDNGTTLNNDGYMITTRVVSSSQILVYIRKQDNSTADLRFNVVLLGLGF